MANQSPFLKSLIGASKSAKQQGWPSGFDPMKTVSDTFNSVMSGAGGIQRDIGSGVQGFGKTVGDFSSMAQGNLGAVQTGLQGLGHALFGAKPKVRPGPNLGVSPPRGGSMLSIPTYPSKSRKRTSRKASK